LCCGPGKTPSGDEVRAHPRRLVQHIRARRAIENLPVLRGNTETRHKAKSWDCERRAVPY
jgi:hypothetical protein